MDRFLQLFDLETEVFDVFISVREDGMTADMLLDSVAHQKQLLHRVRLEIIRRRWRRLTDKRICAILRDLAKRSADPANDLWKVYAPDEIAALNGREG